MSDFTDDLDALGDFPEEYNPWHNPDDWKTITRRLERDRADLIAALGAVTEAFKYDGRSPSRKLRQVEAIDAARATLARMRAAGQRCPNCGDPKPADRSCDCIDPPNVS